MDKLNKKLAEWSGFKEMGGGIIAPNGAIYWEKEYDFTNSLDACFKWLVPKALKMGMNTMLYHSHRGWNANFIWLANVGGKRRQRVTNAKYDAMAETPALALCLAISKLIDGEKDDSI